MLLGQQRNYYSCTLLPMANCNSRIFLLTKSSRRTFIQENECFCCTFPKICILTILPSNALQLKNYSGTKIRKWQSFFLHNTSFLQICFCRRGNKIRKGESEFFCCSYYLKLFQCEEKKFKNRQIFCLEYIFCFLSCFPGVVVALLQIRLNVFVSEWLFTGL